MRGFLLGLLALGLVLGTTGMARASHIATIDGQYDDQADFGGAGYDTPSLIFHNTSTYDLTNAKVVLHGYQGLNNGVSKTLNLGTITAGTDYGLLWNDGYPGVVTGDLFSYDYDDSYGVAPFTVGNFDVTFTAVLSGAGLLNGQHVFSVFSPTTNATGGFVGWEGLDPNGVAENFTYDTHNGTLNGTLANIDLGDPPSAPEPGTLTLAGFGIASMLGYAWRKRRQRAAA
jgi:hypothetical protein